jgi:hypothetical protein
MTGRVFCGAVFSPSTTAADALPAIAKDIPAAPHIGNAALERFRFEVCFARAMVDLPVCEKFAVSCLTLTFLNRHVTRGNLAEAGTHPKLGSMIFSGNRRPSPIGLEGMFFGILLTGSRRTPP